MCGGAGVGGAVARGGGGRGSAASVCWPRESSEAARVSVVDRERNAVSLTYTLEDSYGVKIVVPGAGFLLNNEMGDFNAGAGLTNADGLIGTDPNLSAPGKRMLSSMTPTILVKDGKVALVIGSLGGRTIINSVLLAILNVVDFGMNIQEAGESARMRHGGEELYLESGIGDDVRHALAARGHRPVDGRGAMGGFQGILIDPKSGVLMGGVSPTRDSYVMAY